MGSQRPNVAAELPATATAIASASAALDREARGALVCFSKSRVVCSRTVKCPGYSGLVVVRLGHFSNSLF